jgi:histidyl-tRNA synthetase
MGFSIGVERLLEALEKGGVESSRGKESAVAYILTLDGRSQIKGYELASFMRSEGVKVELNMSQRGLSSQLKLVNRKKIRWTLILGEKEVEEGIVILRDMDSGKQEAIEWGRWDRLKEKLKA